MCRALVSFRRTRRYILHTYFTQSYDYILQHVYMSRTSIVVRSSVFITREYLTWLKCTRDESNSVFYLLLGWYGTCTPRIHPRIMIMISGPRYTSNVNKSLFVWADGWEILCHSHIETIYRSIWYWTWGGLFLEWGQNDCVLCWCLYSLVYRLERI